MAKLRRLNLRPATVVDVGVGPGTPYLYEAFPEAFHLLLEPLTEFEPRLRQILQRLRGDYELTAVGARRARRVMHVDPQRTVRSSLLDRTVATASDAGTVPREVPVTTLDAVLEVRALEPPFGLKIDTEGYELEVIRGATRFLRQTAFVVAEVSVARRFRGSYSFAEFVAAMDRHGFRMAHVVDMVGLRRPELLYVDAVFVPRAD